MFFTQKVFTVRHNSRTFPEAAADSSNESLMVILITCKGLNVSGSLDCKSARSGRRRGWTAEQKEQEEEEKRRTQKHEIRVEERK